MQARNTIVLNVINTSKYKSCKANFGHVAYGWVEVRKRHRL